MSNEIVILTKMERAYVYSTLCAEALSLDSAIEHIEQFPKDYESPAVAAAKLGESRMLNRITRELFDGDE